MGVAGGTAIMPHLRRVRTRNFGERDAAARIETTTQEPWRFGRSGTYAPVPGEGPWRERIPPDWPPAAGGTVIRVSAGVLRKRHARRPGDPAQWRRDDFSVPGVFPEICCGSMGFAVPEAPRWSGDKIAPPTPANRRSMPNLIRFGEFALNPHSGELLWRASRLMLQNRPLQVLMLLLEHPGDAGTI
jgi:hypothetical protein